MKLITDGYWRDRTGRDLSLRAHIHIMGKLFYRLHKQLTH